MKKIDEIGMGAFRPELTPTGKHYSSNFMMSPTSDADSHFSKSMQRLAYERDEEEEEILQQDSSEDEALLEKTILTCRVKIGRKFKLVETLNKLHEFENYSDKFKMQMSKINNNSGERLDSVDRLPDLEDEIENIDEFSGAAAGGGGPAVPVGYTSKGKPETRSQRKKRQRFNREKSFPYK